MNLGGGAQRVLVVVAHPDDEIVGAGILMSRLPGVAVLHVTDGAPRDVAFRPKSFTGSRAAYAAARRRELKAAMKLAGIGPERLYTLGIPDQEASLAMVEIAQEVASYARKLGAEVVLTHAYEGGHPDHDATALACRAAYDQLRREGGPVPDLMEMALYHADPMGNMVLGKLLPAPADYEGKVVHWKMSPSEMDLKRRMIECFATQRETLAPFLPPPEESFRPAPLYDFSQPPHPGILQYELWGFPLTGERWRRLAREATEELGIGVEVRL